MSYYHDIITQKSWEELQVLNQRITFVLIGGWATYLYTKTLKSKDIDIIVDYDQLPLLQNHYRLVKNERLTKYEAIREEVQIDVYLPHYSQLGIPVALLQNQTRNVEGYTLLDANYLLALKIFTHHERARSAKGEKDFIDIMALINSEQADLSHVKSLLESHSLQHSIPTFDEILNEHRSVPELNFTQHTYSKIKKKITAHFDF